MTQLSRKRSQGICLVVCLVLSPLSIEFSSMSGNEIMEGYQAGLLYSEKIQEKKWNAVLGGIKRRFSSHILYLVTNDSSHLPSPPEFSLKRTGSALVGSIMSLLATFESAGVLPPEGTSEANQLIHGLIQLQSALVKSQSSELREYLSGAVNYRRKREGEPFLPSVQQSGLTSKMLEALLMYDKKTPMWDQPGLLIIFQRYNVTQADWRLIVGIFIQAEAAYRSKGTSIHTAYERWQLQVSGRP